MMQNNILNKQCVNNPKTKHENKKQKTRIQCQMINKHYLHKYRLKITIIIIVAMLVVSAINVYHKAIASNDFPNNKHYCMVYVEMLFLIFISKS